MRAIGAALAHHTIKTRQAIGPGAGGSNERKDAKVRSIIRPLVLVLLTAVLGVPATQAEAATTVGQVADSGATFSSCSTVTVYVQFQTQGPNPYLIPSAGVITSWSTREPDATAHSLKLKVLTPVNRPGAEWQVAGSSALGATGSAGLNTFSSRIPVSAGQELALWNPNGSSNCRFVTASLSDESIFQSPGPASEPTDGSTYTASGGSVNNVRLNVSAQLEADADHDGFGDETQDQCPTNGTTQGVCPVTPAPVTPVAKKKCKKNKKHKSGALIAKKCKKKH